MERLRGETRESKRGVAGNGEIEKSYLNYVIM